MIRKILILTWLPIVAGVWFALWVLLTPEISSTELTCHTIALWSAAGGLLWSAIVVVRRLISPKTKLTNRQQIMFDVVCYPILVLALLYLIKIIF